jgi:Ser-Thr-rich glycosyl-phosphatidyl-inositol-anchored membrane family
MHRLPNRCRSLFLLLPAIILIAATNALAQPFNWLLPQGGETWTAGTTHTVEWSGGPVGNVTVYAISVTPFQVADVIAASVPNTGFAQWTIPTSLAPGQYNLFVGDPGFTTYTYGPTFNVQAGPNCGAGCTLTTANMPFYGYPGGACDATVGGAQAAATAYLQALINSACASGYTLDPSSVIIDVTILPFGTCFSGYMGQFIAEASAVFCCCAHPVPTQQKTWGAIKSRYR